MEHYGDITKISGYNVPITDVVIGGSPCQDLSVAGKREGLAGKRSGLFMEQIRIIKEMREKDVRENGRAGRFIRPRYMVWENVPGAFSSGKPKGEDFRIVLEEIARVCDENAVIPRPADGKWRNAGCILGDGWSIAWRVLDAQFWGVPQRRRRIALVADFGGHTAPEILFEREGVSRDNKPLGETGKTAAGDTADRAPATDFSFQERAGCAGGARESSSSTGERARSQQLTTKESSRSYRDESVFDARGNGDGSVCPTLTGDHQNRVTDYTAVAVFRKTSHPANKTDGQGYEQTDKSDTLSCFDITETRTPMLVAERSQTVQAERETAAAVDSYNGTYQGDKTATLTSNGSDRSNGIRIICELTDFIRK